MSDKERFIDGMSVVLPQRVCFPNLGKAEYVRYTMVLEHKDMLTDRSSDPKNTDEVVRVLMKAKSHGNAMIHEEDGYGEEWVADMTGMFLGLMMEVTGMSDCQLGCIVRDIVTDFISRGC